MNLKGDPESLSKSMICGQNRSKVTKDRIEENFKTVMQKLLENNTAGTVLIQKRPEDNNTNGKQEKDRVKLYIIPDSTETDVCLKENRFPSLEGNFFSKNCGNDVFRLCASFHDFLSLEVRPFKFFQFTEHVARV